MTGTTERTHFRPFWICALAYLVVACVANVDYTGPVQRWWKDRGPVVRHDSFPADCTLCHVEGTWSKIREDFEYDHLAETGHALEGAHSSAECLRCHNDRGPVQTFAQRGCSGCHEDVHRGQLGPTCNSCHGEENWRVFDFIAEHNATRLPLIGAHAAAACWSCHPGAQNGEFTRLDPDCASCHQAAIALATTPNHVASGWTTGCDRCHMATQWKGVGFAHATFPLTGAHVAADCSECHVGNVFAGTPSDCASCHQDEYQATTAPNHTMSAFPMNCDQCHSTIDWMPAIFNHTWPLTGAHAPLDCTECHVGGIYQGTPTDCNSCHQSDYQATTSPNHAMSGFPTSCEDCHGTMAWTPSSFNHSFALNGAHAPLDCTECHGGGIYQGTPTTCFGCHQSDFQSTSSPNHAAAGFGTSCDQCHSEQTWTPATFNHSWALTGAHAPLDCNECHGGGTYQGTPTDCFSCHQADHAATTMPNHTQSGFGNSCDDCHTTIAWTPATFNHSFPTVGQHNLNCIDCHTTNMPPAFSCIDCHEHRQSEAAMEHEDGNLAGYVWASAACLSCHPTGNKK